MSPIRVIGENGENLGVMETPDALVLARERGLDLIEIAPNVQPPVCRIIDFGKFKYEREKGERERAKKHHESEMKGVRIGFTTGQHDLEMRARQIQTFLERGDKVRIEMRLRGREKALGETAMEKFRSFIQSLPLDIATEMPPRRTPNGINAVIIKGKSAVSAKTA